jgi:hypothetical protein
VILSELSGPFLTREILRRAGEIAPLPLKEAVGRPPKGEKPLSADEGIS